MADTKKRVLISGAGVAGMACAILLDEEKYDIELIEQASAFRNIGFSIVLWKSGFSLLTGLVEKNSGHIEEGKDCFALDGFNLFAGSRFRLLKKLSAVGYAWAFERKRLMEILESILVKHVQPEHISFSRGIRHIEYTRDLDMRALVTFRDGVQKEYDIVVIAEGIHSSSRELVGVHERIISIPYVLRYAWFASATALGTYGGLFFGERKVAVIHPPYFKSLLGFYFDKGDSTESQTAFVSAVAERIKQADGTNTVLDITTSDIFELKEVHLDRYYAKNVVFVGDAAHGRPPTLGFGTSLALEDATVLSEKLNALRDASATEITAALASYSGLRNRRVEKVYRLQGRLQKFYTKSRLKVLLLSFLVEMFYGTYMEYRVKKLASFDIFSA